MALPFFLHKLFCVSSFFFFSSLKEYYITSLACYYIFCKMPPIFAALQIRSTFTALLGCLVKVLKKRKLTLKNGKLKRKLYVAFEKKQRSLTSPPPTPKNNHKSILALKKYP